MEDTEYMSKQWLNLTVLSTLVVGAALLFHPVEANADQASCSAATCQGEGYWCDSNGNCQYVYGTAQCAWNGGANPPYCYCPLPPSGNITDCNNDSN